MSAPTGRSGRLRLVHQVEVARRGSDLLERKRRILAGELTRLRLTTRRTGQDWQQAAAEAALWAARSQALDGAQRLADSAAPTPATVTVSRRSAMGVVYPADAVVRLPARHRTGGSSALVIAVQVHRAALDAAARHAAAERALARVSAELESTRLRQQAVDRRWLPRLTGSLRRLETQLDEQEREENVRMRWAAGVRAKEAP